MQALLRPFGLIGLLVGVLLASLVVPASPARAAGQLRIELTTITPTVLTNHGDLVISGTVTNESPDEMHDVEVWLWRDATPLTSIDALEDESSAARRGALLESARQMINQGAPLAPGASAEFTVRAALGPNAAEQSWLSEPDAAYRVGVEVYAAGYELLGRATTLIAYPGSEPVPFGTIVVLNAPPSLLPLDAPADQPPVFANATLAAELSGRLNALLDLAEQPGVLTVIDPALYTEVATLAQPHNVIVADAVVAGDQADRDLAADWLDRVDQLAAAKTLVRGLYGTPDVAAAVASDRPEVIDQAGQALPADHPLARLPLVVVPATGQLNQPTAARLATTDPWFVLATELPGTSCLQTDQGLNLLAVQPPAAAESSAEPLAERGWQLAHQLVGARNGTPQVQLVDSSEQVAVELEELSWRTRRSLDELLVDQQPESVLLPQTSTAAAGDPLIGATDRVTAVFATWQDLVTDQESAAPELSVIIATGWSTTFSGQAGAQARWITRASQPATEMITPRAVQLRISDWVTTSADENLLPVTVINNTNREVRVRVEFESENPLRISVDDSELVNVQPGESTTVRVRPRTHGNGKVAISAQLSTAGGHNVGEATSFVITGTEAGRVAWLIIVASGAVLLVATALRVRQVRRERSHG